MPTSPRPLTLLLALLACLALAGPATAGPGMIVGAAEDAAKSADIVVAKAKMDLARIAGFDAVRLTATWTPGATQLEGYELLALENATAAASLSGMRVFLSVYHAGSRTTPRTRRQRLDFAAFTASLPRDLPWIEDFIIGNEPNLNRFWLPQFNRDGTSASPGAYLGLLALTYDALKAVSPEIRVIGGSVSPRGQDDPRAKRHTHSPVRFLDELGRAYRRSGRARPVMDALAFHPYGDNSSQAPEFVHHPLSTRIGISEYDKLVAALASAFDGTPQRGADLPIIYDEYGADTRIPRRKRSLYVGREPRTTRPVDERTQGDYYRRALAIAACQPTVAGLLFFHVSDERDLDRWQSGLFYADDTPKASFNTVKAALEELRSPARTEEEAAARCGEIQARVEAAQLRAARDGLAAFAWSARSTGRGTRRR